MSTRAIGRHRASAASLVAGWRALPWAIRMLRAFLGVTFVYAGIQKLADPNFFHSGTPDFIGSQLLAFSKGSPIGAPLRLLAHVPVLTGLGIALAEIAVGAGTLLGIGAIPAAVGGLLINLTLTMSATWHVHPYFLGSDSMYAVAWGAYLIGLVEIERRRRKASRKQRPPVEQLGRREFLRGSVLAGLTVLLGALAHALAGPAAAIKAAPRAARPGDGPASPSPAGNTSPAVQGKEIATLRSIQVGGAIPFQAPGVGPAVLVRTAQNRVAAFSRTCTHAGCLVDYDPSSRVLFCPCHGAGFDPSRQAAVIAGPAPAPLAPVRVAIDEASGSVVLPT